MVFRRPFKHGRKPRKSLCSCYGTIKCTFYEWAVRWMVLMHSTGMKGGALLTSSASTRIKRTKHTTGSSKEGRQKKHTKYKTDRPKFSFRSFFTPVPHCDPWLTWTTIVLMGFGLVMVLSSKLGTTMGSTAAYVLEVIKQLVFVIGAWELGVVGLSRLFPYKLMNNSHIQNLSILIYTGLLVATALIGIEAGGSKAWLGVGGMTIQPSEFGKVLLIVLLASSGRLAGSSHAESESFLQMFRRPLLMIAISILFVGGLQKDFGSLIITLGIALVGILVTTDPHISKWQRGILLAVIIILIVLFIGVYFSDIFVKLFSDTPLLRHIATRIENMKNPYADIHSAGYQPANALYSLADAGLFGRGLGSSVRKYGFLTQAESDYILAIVIEETGLIGLLIITIGYGILLWRLSYWALAARKPYDKILFSCACAYFMLHFFINVGGVATLIPMTGVPLLLISAGGTALISAGMVIGICQNRISKIASEDGEHERRRQSFKKRMRETTSDLDFEDE